MDDGNFRFIIPPRKMYRDRLFHPRFSHNLGMTDENSAQTQAVFFTQQTGTATFAKVLQGVIVHTKVNTDVFGRQVF